MVQLQPPLQTGGRGGTCCSSHQLPARGDKVVSLGVLAALLGPLAAARLCLQRCSRCHRSAVTRSASAGPSAAEMASTVAFLQVYTGARNTAGHNATGQHGAAGLVSEPEPILPPGIWTETTKNHFFLVHLRHKTGAQTGAAMCAAAPGAALQGGLLSTRR